MFHFHPSCSRLESVCLFWKEGWLSADVGGRLSLAFFEVIRSDVVMARGS